MTNYRILDYLVPRSLVDEAEGEIWRHRGQTSEHAREIARGSHRSIRKTLYVAVTTACLLVSCKRNFLFTSMKFIGDDREEEEKPTT